MTGITAVLLSYLIGSFPTGYVVARLVKGVDIRAQGSGATGATNARRLLGTRWGAAIALFDVVKGVVAVTIARELTAGDLWPALAGAAAVIGHCWPVWLGFRGGKGVATGGGAAIALSLWALALVPLLVVVVAAWRYVSLGSLIAAAASVALFGALAAMNAGPAANVAFALVTALAIGWRHRENIARLRGGTERRLGRGEAPPGAVA